MFCPLTCTASYYTNIWTRDHVPSDGIIPLGGSAVKRCTGIAERNSNGLWLQAARLLSVVCGPARGEHFPSAVSLENTVSDALRVIPISAMLAICMASRGVHGLSARAPAPGPPPPVATRRSCPWCDTDAWPWSVPTARTPPILSGYRVPRPQWQWAWVGACRGFGQGESLAVVGFSGLDLRGIVTRMELAEEP